MSEPDKPARIHWSSGCFRTFMLVSTLAKSHTGLGALTQTQRVWHNTDACAD